MSFDRRCPTILMALLAVACSDEISTAPDLVALASPLDLDLLVPAVTHETFVDRKSWEVPASAVALISEAEQPPEEDLVAGIWNAYTDVDFLGTTVWAWGEHDYTGNKGRVEVTATAHYEGITIGSRTGVFEQTNSFFNPFMHHIVGEAKIYTDHDCGLSADAYSEHQAWWEIAPGSGPSTFAREIQTTGSGLKRQVACASPSYAGYDGGGGGGGGGYDINQMMCYFLVEYDMWTGEIYDVDFLYCTEGG